MSQVLNHLLFHKAMIGIDTEKIDQYIEIAGSASSAAEVVTVDDPFTRSVTLLFMLVSNPALPHGKFQQHHGPHRAGRPDGR